MVSDDFLAAHPGRVKLLLDFLLEQMNVFCDAHPEIEILDQFMAVHNFHVVFVLSLERDLRFDTGLQLFTRELALETFKRALENKPAFRQERKSNNA